MVRLARVPDADLLQMVDEAHSPHPVLGLLMREVVGCESAEPDPIHLMASDLVGFDKLIRVARRSVNHLHQLGFAQPRLLHPQPEELLSQALTPSEVIRAVRHHQYRRLQSHRLLQELMMRRHHPLVRSVVQDHLLPLA